MDDRGRPWWVYGIDSQWFAAAVAAAARWDGVDAEPGGQPGERREPGDDDTDT